MLSAMLRRVRTWSDARFDRRYGIDTCAADANVPELAEDRAGLDIPAYLPAGFGRVRRLFRRANVDVRDFNFVDLGCGKGRVLLLADRAGFRTVTGIEISERLCRIADKNVEAWRKYHRNTDIAVVCGDARTAPLPEGDLFIFMYNPFSEAVLNDVAGRLADLSRAGRRMLIAFAGDAHSAALERTGQFKRERIRPLRWWLPSTMSIFRSAD